MNLDFARLDRSELIGVAGGVVLALSLFLPWYGIAAGAELNGVGGPTTMTAWQTFNVLDILLLAGASAPLILAWIVVRGHQLSWAPGEVTAIVGLIATVLILYNGIIDRAGPGLGIGLRFGWFLGLVGAFCILTGGALRSTMQTATRRPPGTFD